MAQNTQPPPPLIGQPNVPLFKKESFDAVIWNKGYEIILEQAIACPCRGKSGSPRQMCNNCLGIGWVFVNPLSTRAIITSINKDTKFKPWSPELTGTISVTLMDENKISFMDKVTFKSRYSTLSEVREMIYDQTEEAYFCFTSYKINKINSIFIFKSDTEKLIKVSPDLYTIKDNRNIIEFDTDFDPAEPFNHVISIDYEYEVSYNIIDIPHDFRSAFLINENGVNVEHNLPVQGIARRTHHLIGESYKFVSEKLNNDY